MFVLGSDRMPQIINIEILEVNEIAANEMNENILSDLWRQ